MIRFLLALIVIFAFGGCVLKPEPQPVQSEISLAFSEYKPQNMGFLPISLKVQMPQGISIESDKIFYVNQDGARRPYAFHRWEGSLASQLHERLVLAFAQRNSFKDVAKQGEMMQANWILESEILDFSQWMHGEESASVKLIARMRLVDVASREGIGGLLVNYEVPMEALGIQGATKAYNQALKMWLDETLEWVQDIGEKKYAR